MNSHEKKVTAGLAKGFFSMVRLVLYVVLLLLGRVLHPIANFAIGAGVLVFLFCLVFRPDMTIPMWAGAALAVVSTVVSVFYQVALRMVAPDDVVIVHEV